MRTRLAGLLLCLATLSVLLAGCAPSDSWNEPLYLDTLYIDGVEISPPSYGELYETSEGGNPIDMAASGTFYQWASSTAGDTAGSSYVVADEATDTLTIGPAGAGKYMVMVAFSFSGSVNILVEGAVFLNGVRQQRLEFNRFMGESGSQGFSGIMGIMDLVAGDVLDFRVKNDNNAKTVAVRHLSLAINRVGR